MAKTERGSGSKGISPYVIALRDELLGGSMKQLGRFALGDLDVEVCQGRDSIWAIVRREGKGGLALRAVHVAGGGFTSREREAGAGRAFALEVDSPVGRHRVEFTTSGPDIQRLRVKVTFTPAVAMRIPFIPRDLYPLDNKDDPTGAVGSVEATQRVANNALVYLRVDEPAFGSVLYFQNLTSLNRYFLATGTKPTGVAGGDWPELGYLPPTPESQDVDEPNLLPAGEEIVLSDAIIVMRDQAGDTEQEMALQFLHMLDIIYRTVGQPEVEYRDWVTRSERTIRDLETSKQARSREYGNLYIMPYPDGEYPDSMVQLTVAQALHEWNKWNGKKHPLEAELKRGLEKFYDPEFKTLRRYLPNVGEEQGKDPDAVDSWYLYHPMLNLGRLALDGDEKARDLLLRSIDYGIKAAHHFDYAWPIMYKIQDFSIITKARGDERFGETDVNGIYAYIMVQCYELTGEQRFVEEACRAIDKAKGLRFDLLYQVNLTVWGAVACLRLWRITNRSEYLAQSYAYLAGFFHNTIIWESEIGTAANFPSFFGAVCLHDAPYMALYECFECFVGLDEYLAQGGPGLDHAARLLVSEFCKHTLNRAWFYYPDMLPRDAIPNGDHQSGVINRELSFPLEDLYPAGDPAGQVGQEIYGCGAAFALAVRSHHHVEGAPFRLYCDHFIRVLERTGDRAISVQIDGGETCIANAALVRLPRRKLPGVSVVTAGGDAVETQTASGDRIDFRVPASGRFILTWN